MNCLLPVQIPNPSIRKGEGDGHPGLALVVEYRSGNTVEPRFNLLVIHCVAPFPNFGKLFQQLLPRGDRMFSDGQQRCGRHIFLHIFLGQKCQDRLAHAGTVHRGPLADLGVDNHGAVVVYLVDVNDLALREGGQMDCGAVFVRMVSSVSLNTILVKA